MGQTRAEDRIINITLGTAGHIDHGKSALVNRFTGIDPDRLKEEQDRGMTIDLGYAFYETRAGRRVGVIDVPGHEKFVKNMVAGAASIDLVCLVVAADDGVMPQTREHLDIMTVLGLKKGFVALTKIDLIDEEMQELAAEDIKDLTAGTFLDGCPIVPVSSITGAGMDRFIDCLEEMIEQVEHQSASGLFRMPVQRVFSAKGFGTVVTGVPMSGNLKIGDPVEVLPPGLKGKVRGMQAFGEQQEKGNAGHRVAINIADVDYHDVHRGHSITTPGFFKPIQYFEGLFTYFKSLDGPLKNMTEIKVHAGTAEQMGKIVLLDAKVLLPGQQGYVQVRLAEPMVLAPGDRFLIRRHSPALSLGGGMVIELSNRKVRRFKDRLCEDLDSRHTKIQDTISSLLEFEMRRWKSGLFGVRDLAEAVCQRTDVVEEVLKTHLSSGVVLDVGRGLYVHEERFLEIARKVVEILDDLHRAQPLHPYLDITKLRSRLQIEGPALQSLLKIMEGNGQIETAKGGRIRRAGFKVELDGKQLAMAEQVKVAFIAASLTPASVPDLAKQLDLTPAQVEAMVDYLLAAKELQRVGSFYFSSHAMEALKEAVRACSREHGEVVIPLIREQFATTRKYIIPLMEYLDDTGMTRREGDQRFLAE